MMKKLFFLSAFASIGLLVQAWGVGEKWREPYEGEDAKGAEVMGFWNFDPNAPAKEASSHSRLLRLRGVDSRFAAGGRFEGALEIGAEQEPGDSRQGVVVEKSAALNPSGAFSIEMWIEPGEGLSEVSRAYLLDKKYYIGPGREGDHRGYSLILRREGKEGYRFRLEAALGFGNETGIALSNLHEFGPGMWHHVMWTYDGQGMVRFYVNGMAMGETQLDAAGGVVPSNFDLVLGDRIGSVGYRFLGKISEVRISSQVLVPTNPDAVMLEMEGERRVFRRKEAGAVLKLRVSNRTAKEITGAELICEGIASRVAVPRLVQGETVELALPINTSLRVGRYNAEARLEVKGVPRGEGMSVEIELVPQALPHRMPVVAWAGLGEKDFSTIKEIGFTHFINPWQWSAAAPVDYIAEQTRPELRRVFDRALAEGLGVVASISPRSKAFQAQYPRVERDGTRTERLNGIYPEVPKIWREAGGYIGKLFGDLPAFEGAMIGSETRDHTKPSFADVDRAAWHAVSGEEIPAEVEQSRGIALSMAERLPYERVVSWDHPILKYYRWFWKEGDGWNQLYTEASEGLKAAGRSDFWTWHDPAVRTPSVWGSGGAVDYLSQWTYTYPDPLKISLATDELAAMAQGREGQGIMGMTQLIWYRAQVTTPGTTGVSPAPWEQQFPEARFITIAPDHLSEALWLLLSHPVKGVMYHGWGSLVGSGEGYTRTLPDVAGRLGELVRRVVEPLGPTLVQVPDRPADVAFLQSFTSQILAGKGTYGWGRGWGADAYLVVRYAGFQPEIVYEETIRKRGLKGFRVLVLTDCDVLPEETVAAIQAFQREGGLVVGDELLVPGIQPDVLLESFRRTNEAHGDKQALLARAETLGAELRGVYEPVVSSTNREVVLRLRRAGEGDYLFAVNDRRSYGDYVGQYGRVMEKGVAASTHLALRRESGAVYDLLRRREVAVEKTAGGLSFPLALDAGEGALFLVLDRPVGALRLNAAAHAEVGSRLDVVIRLEDQAGGAVSAVVPMEVKITDAEGRSAELSGHYGAAGGELRLPLELAQNEIPGWWEIEVVEGLTGQRVAHRLEVRAGG